MVFILVGWVLCTHQHVLRDAFTVVGAEHPPYALLRSSGVWSDAE